MKFSTINKLIIIAITLITNLQNTYSTNLKNPKQTLQEKINKKFDDVVIKIREHIHHYALKLMKSKNLISKGRVNGILPEGNPDSLINKAYDTRQDKVLWGNIMDLPAEVYRHCVHPFSKINYVKWCRNSYFTDKKKIDGKLVFYLINSLPVYFLRSLLRSVAISASKHCSNEHPRGVIRIEH